NVIVGIVGGMLACMGRLSPRRQEFLLYMAVSILTVNSVNVVLSEWGLHFSDMSELLKNHPNHMLIDYACFATRIATAAVIVVSFLDSQFAFCSMQITPAKIDKKKLHGSHEQVSDIEYIIPRPKSSKPHTTVYNAYSQSWVFDSDSASCSNNAESPYLKILENGTPKNRVKKLQNGMVNDTTHLIDNPVVHIEEASDDSNSNSDRKLCHMRSFSRSASPVLSASSSHINLHQTGNPPIYDCLETIYRTRLASTAREEPHYQAPQTMVLRRVESVSPHAEKVQYASLMKELQRAIVSKKEPSVTSPLSTSESATASEKTQTDSKSSSRHESSDCKSSDAEFSKELEAALQLIQDLESPNTIETPSEPKSESRPLAVWRNSDASESEKTLSAVGSLAEIASPLAECQPELFKAAANGKGASVIIHHYPDSQSTSGYSSPTQPSDTPSWSTTSSLNGSNNDIVKPLAYSIHNAKSATVISLYSRVNPQSKGRSVTLVNISGDSAPSTPGHDSTANSHTKNQDRFVWKSLLRKKKLASPPKLCPELEGAIVKSESLAYLSELELLARHQRNKEIQRCIM
ncbi:suppressor protein SRP40-like, partial [Asbolus verrucosus]